MGCCNNSKKEPKEKSSCCSGNNDNKIVLACSGGSNVGQVSNNVMIKMNNNGDAVPYCLAGVGADLSGFVRTAEASKTIVIDGCPVACAKKIFEKHNLKPDNYFIITELGIEKNHNFDNLDEETKIAYEKIVKKIY